jgi:hypothetical protein
MTSPHQYGPQQPPSSSGFPPATMEKPKPGTPPKPRSASGGRLLVVGLAAFAVLLGLVSVGFSWRASSKASDALDKLSALSTAAPVQPVSAASAPPTTPPDEPATSAPTPGPSGSDPELSKETQFGVKYVKESLRVPAGCSTSIYVDVDEPRVRLDEGLSELTFFDPCGIKTPYITLSPGVRGSVTDSDNVTPSECVDLIRRSPLAIGEQPIRQGQVYCVNTSKAAAIEAADTWKMVIMTIDAIAQDGAVTIEASSWNIPE